MGTIPKVTTRIKDHLTSHPELKTNACFAGLYQEGHHCVAILTLSPIQLKFLNCSPPPLNKLKSLPPGLESFSRIQLQHHQLVCKHAHAHGPSLNQDLGHYQCHKHNQHLTFCTRIMVLCQDNDNTNLLLAYKFMWQSCNPILQQFWLNFVACLSFPPIPIFLLLHN